MEAAEEGSAAADVCVKVVMIWHILQKSVGRPGCLPMIASANSVLTRKSAAVTQGMLLTTMMKIKSE